MKKFLAICAVAAIAASGTLPTMGASEASAAGLKCKVSIGTTTQTPVFHKGGWKSVKHTSRAYVQGSDVVYVGAPSGKHYLMKANGKIYYKGKMVGSFSRCPLSKIKQVIA